MDTKKKLNTVVDDYQKRLKDPNWNVNKKQGAEMSKGATRSGSQDFSWSNLKKSIGFK